MSMYSALRQSSMVLPRLQLLSTGSDLRSTSPASVTHGKLTRVRNFRVGGASG